MKNELGILEDTPYHIARGEEEDLLLYCLEDIVIRCINPNSIAFKTLMLSLIGMPDKIRHHLYLNSSPRYHNPLTNILLFTPTQ